MLIVSLMCLKKDLVIFILTINFIYNYYVNLIIIILMRSLFYYQQNYLHMEKFWQYLEFAKTLCIFIKFKYFKLKINMTSYIH